MLTCPHLHNKNPPKQGTAYCADISFRVLNSLYSAPMVSVSKKSIKYQTSVTGRHNLKF